MQMPSNCIQRVHQSFRSKSVKRSFRQDISLTPNYKSQTSHDFKRSSLFAKCKITEQYYCTIMWDIRVREKNTTETLVDMPLGTKVMSEKDSCKLNTQKD